jgi:phosphoglucomutase
VPVNGIYTEQPATTGKLPSNGFVVKTIVTTELARTIAKAYGVTLVEVLTGFKFIGEADPPSRRTRQ